jgi:hypothetical protein
MFSLVLGIAAPAAYSYFSNFVAPYWASSATETIVHSQINNAINLFPAILAQNTMFKYGLDALVSNPIAARAGYLAYDSALNGVSSTMLDAIPSLIASFMVTGLTIKCVSSIFDSKKNLVNNTISENDSKNSVTESDKWTNKIQSLKNQETERAQVM